MNLVFRGRKDTSVIPKPTSVIKKIEIGIFADIFSLFGDLYRYKGDHFYPIKDISAIVGLRGGGGGLITNVTLRSIMWPIIKWGKHMTISIIKNMFTFKN